MPFSLCPECGNKIQEEFQFCPICGKKLREERKEAEKRWVTVVFTDIKGFTSMSEALDPEEIHKTLDKVFKELTEVIEKRGGYVDKYIGDAIMALFGAPKSYGDDTERAIYSAFEMQEILKRHGILARIGINSGFVLTGKIGKGRAGDYTAIGDTVNTAQRIESVTEPGKIWVSEKIYKELRDKFEFKPLGIFELKGKKEKVKLFEALYPKRKEEEEFPFYNREKELSILNSLYEKIDEGPFFVLLTGEAGVGKTRLINEFIKQKKERAIYLTPNPYSKEFLSEWDPIFQIAEKKLNTLRDSIMYIRNLIKEKGLEESEVSLIYLFKRILKTLEEENIRIIVIEKLGFWDDISKRILLKISNEIEETKLLILITERKKDIEFPESKRIIKIYIEPLKYNEFEKFIDRLFLNPPQNKKVFYERTLGNFSILKTLIYNLEEKEILRKKNGKWSFEKKIEEIEFPQTYLNLIQSWIDSLSKPARELVSIISLIGDDVPFEILKRIYEKKERFMFEIALEEATKKGILKQSEEKKNIFRLSVPEIKKIIRDRLIKEEKKEMHRLIAQTLEEIKEENLSEVIFYHYKESDNLKKAKIFLEKAIEKEIDNFNFEKATKLIEELKKIGEGDEYLLYTAQILKSKGKLDEALTQIEKIKDEKLKIKALPLETTIRNIKGEYDENIKEINLYLPKVEESSTRNSLLFELAIAFQEKGEYEKALEIYMNLLQSINFLRDKILPEVLNAMAVLFSKKNNYELAFSSYEAAINKAKEFNNMPMLATILYNMAHDLINVKGELDTAEKFFKKALEISEKLNNPVQIAITLQGFGYLFSKKGNLEKALEYYMNAREVFQEIKRFRDLYVVEQNIANIFSNKCMFKEAENFYKISIEKMERSGNPFDIVLGKINYGTMLLSLKRLDEAKELFEYALKLAEENNFNLGKAYILANLSILKFLKKEKNYREYIEKAIELIGNTPIHKEYILLRKARLCFFSGEKEEAKHTINYLVSQINKIKDTRYKCEVLIMKSLFQEKEEKEKILKSLINEARMSGNDRIILKILYILKNINKNIEKLYENFLSKIERNMDEKDRKGFVEMLLLI